MAHTLKHKKAPPVGLNLLTLFVMKVYHLKNGLYFNVPFFNGTKTVAIKIDFTYEADNEKMLSLLFHLGSLEPEVRSNNLSIIYRKIRLAPNEENNVITGVIEIHLFKPITYDHLVRKIQKELKFKYIPPNVAKIMPSEYRFKEKELYPLSEAEITKEVNMIHKYFYNIFTNSCSCEI